jgi:5-methylcytosine-specific restriction protein A
MIASRTELIVGELLEGTGASFAATVRHDGLRRSLKIWFADLDERHGPVAELLPYGLKGHQVRLFFGNFAAAVIGQMRKASEEDVQLARALISSIRGGVTVEIPGQALTDWQITDGSFRIIATVRSIEEPNADSSLIATCREVIVPLMAAMAELIGYDVIDNVSEAEEEMAEGAVLRSVVRRRERNPRNRLLCIRIHGECCTACGLEPRLRYGAAGGVIEVHHLQPLSTLGEPRAYDPRIDLVPLCPTCHRAAHTRRPLPYTPAELRSLIGATSD